MSAPTSLGQALLYGVGATVVLFVLLVLAAGCWLTISDRRAARAREALLRRPDVREVPPHA
jgi:hypothetical protein